MHRAGQPKITFQFLVNIDQRWWRADAGLHAETKAVGLARAMIGILPQDDHAHLVERGQVERAKILPALGVNLFARCFFLQQKFPQVGHIVAGKFTGEGLFPAVVQFYAVIHILLIASRN